MLSVFVSLLGKAFPPETRYFRLAIFASVAVGAIFASLYRHSLPLYLDGDTRRDMSTLYAVLSVFTAWLIGELCLAKHKRHDRALRTLTERQRLEIRRLERRLEWQSTEASPSAASLTGEVRQSFGASSDGAIAHEQEGVIVRLPHVPKALEAVFAIMRKNWSNIDPTRLPKQVNIAREIDAALGKGAGGDPAKDPSRDGKTIAALIRPDSVGDNSDPDRGTT